MASLLERYAGKIKGVLSCFDRVIIHGTLPGLCHASGMTGYLKARGIRIFDYAQWAEPLRARIRATAETLAAQLRTRGISYEVVENAFVDIADFSAAQKLADALHVSRLHQALDRCARLYCPILKPLHTRYHWSLMQVEYATPISSLPTPRPWPPSTSR